MVKKEKSFALQERSPILALLEWIHSYLLLAIFYPLAGAVAWRKGANLWIFCSSSLIVLGAIVLSYFMVRKTRSFALYLAGMLLWMAAGGLAVWIWTDRISGEEYRLLFRSMAVLLTVLFSGITMIIRVKSRIEQSQMARDFEAQHEGEENVLLDSWETATFLNNPMPTHWILYGFAYVVTMLMSRRLAYRMIFVMLLVDILVCFLHYYMESFHQYIKDHHRMANMPLAMMRRVHKMLLGAGLAILTAALLPALLYFREPLEGWRPQIKLNLNLTIEETIEEVTEQATEAPNMMDMLPDDYKEPPAWVLWLMNAIAYLFFAVCVLAIGAYIWAKLKEAGQDFSHGDEDEVVFLDDVSEDTGELLYGKRRAKDGFLSPNARIRRKYRKSIQKGTKGKPNTAASPAELERDAGWTGNTEEENLHRLYEKARYSRSGCTAEDLPQR